ncbi:MAG: tetratricopeptide repeat protein [Pyrinomonadaceae bacterium]
MTNRECQALRFFSATLLICLSVFLSACNSSASFIAKGEEYLQKRKFHDALMQFRSAVESDKGSAAAHWGMARSYENLGQLNETLDELRQTVDLDDANLEAKAKLGNYFLLVQPPMIVEAEKLRSEILTKDSMFIEAHILSASILAAQGRPDSEVVLTVNKAIELNPQRIESYISLQRMYMTRENAVEAEAAIKRGIAAIPDSVLGHTEFGRFLMYSSHDAEAEAMFQKAIALDAANIEAREAIAEFYTTSRQMEKAELANLVLVRIQENSPESRLVLAEFYNAAGRGDEAIATLNAILDEAPEYVLARYRLGPIHLDRKDLTKVNEQLDALFAINDDDVEALLLRARLRLFENNGEDAAKDLEQVLKKQPSGKEALFLMAQARLTLGQMDQAKAFIADLERYHPYHLKTDLLKIQSAFTVGDAQTALKYSNELIEKVANSLPSIEHDARALQDLGVRALSSRGLASLDLGKLGDARTDLEEVVRRSPNSAPAVMNLAKVSIAEGNYTSALGHYKRASDLDGQNFDAVSGVVSMSLRLGQTAEAHGRVDKLIAENGASGLIAAGHYLKSNVYVAEKNLAAAEDQLMTAINLDDGYLPAYSGYAALLVGQNRTEEAIAQYKTIITKRGSAQAYTMLGILEDSLGRTADAEQAYRKALDLNAAMPIAANNLAWLLADNAGNLDEALRLANTAVSKGSGPGFHDTLGWVYLKKGLTSQAIVQFKKAVALEDANAQRNGSTPNPGYRVRLGMALSKSGDKASARREVEASLQNAGFLSQREATDARAVLATL